MWQKNKQTTLFFSPFCIAHIGRQHTRQIHHTTTWIFDVWWSGETNSVSLQTVHSLVRSKNHNSGRQVKLTLIYACILSVIDLIECFLWSTDPKTALRSSFYQKSLTTSLSFRVKWYSILLNNVGLCCRRPIPLPPPPSPPPSIAPLRRLLFMQMTKSSSNVRMF